MKSMKREEFKRRSQASSPDERQNSKFNLHLHFIFRSFLCINCEDSVLIVQSTRRRKVKLTDCSVVTVAVSWTAQSTLVLKGKKISNDQKLIRSDLKSYILPSKAKEE